MCIVNHIATVTSQGQVTIPAPLRKTHFPEGEKIIFEVQPDYSQDKRQERVLLKPALKLKDAIGVAVRYGAKVLTDVSPEEAIALNSQEATHNAAEDDQKIIHQHSSNRP